eukprot:8463861-Pyramimonas_sp.AAC.1
MVTALFCDCDCDCDRATIMVTALFCDFDCDCDCDCDCAQVTALFSSFKLNWPSDLSSIFDSLSIFALNLELLHPECSLSSWDTISQWRLTMLFPPILAALLLATALFEYARNLFAKGPGAALKAKCPKLVEPPPRKKTKGHFFAAWVRYPVGMLLTR